LSCRPSSARTITLTSSEGGKRHGNGGHGHGGHGKRARTHQHAAFQCPICRKRFQRHIAMNAHFQNEHTGANGADGERTCPLCSFRARTVADIRAHMLADHNIDLDSPTACMVDPESPAMQTSPPPQPAVTISRQPVAVTAAEHPRTPPLPPPPPTPSTATVKTEPDSDENERAKDLSVRNQTNVNCVRSGSPGVKRRRPAVVLAKVPATRSVPSTPSDNVEGLTSDHRWRCSHCSIVFPNQTLYFLHRGFHSSDGDPWRCNGCGVACADLYDFNAHLVSQAHA